MTDQDRPVNVYRYLTTRGFTDAQAASIIMRTILRFGVAPVDFINEAAADLGFEVPNLAFPLTTQLLRDRN